MGKTKAEIEQELKALQARNAELEAYEVPEGAELTWPGGVAHWRTEEHGEWPVQASIAAIIDNWAKPDLTDWSGEELVEGAMYQMTEDGLLLVPDTPNDEDEAPDEEAIKDAKDGEILRLQTERDEARNKVAALQRQLRDAGTLHGSIDSLPPVT